MADENAKPDDTPAESKASETLPVVDSPSISPAEAVKEPLVADKPEPLVAEKREPIASDPPKAAPAFSINSRFAMAAAAASVVLAAALGGVFGGLAMGAVPRNDTAVHEREAMQRSLAQLTKEIAGLKAELAATDKTARAQTARVAELGTALKEKLARDQAIVTGSIAAPASASAAVAATPAVAPAQATPLPPPRPAIQDASNRGRDGIIEGWTVLGARRGFAYVQNGRDVYRVMPGDPLPGLGMVEDVRRDEFGWVVVTRRGLIVAARERL
jgi:hypothetical protein